MPVLPKHTVTFILAPGDHAGPAEQVSGPAGAAPTLGGRPPLAGLETRGASPRRPLWTWGSQQRPYARASGLQGAGAGEGAAGGRATTQVAGGRDAAAPLQGSSSASYSRSGPAESAAPRAPK